MISSSSSSSGRQVLLGVLWLLLPLQAVRGEVGVLQQQELKQQGL